jgi:uncharacterized protein YjbK
MANYYIDMKDFMLEIKKSAILRKNTIKRASEILKITSADFIAEKKLTSE